MYLVDVNFLIAAHRGEHVHHSAATGFLKRMHENREVIGFCDIALSGFLRIATHPKIFPVPTAPALAFAFTEDMLSLPGAIRIAPGPDHWKIFHDLYHKLGVKGNLVTDTYLAALALEHGCAMATFDKDFDRFPGLRIVRPG
jgi:toxin-antitoxin system PIN domain toxin